MDRGRRLETNGEKDDHVTVRIRSVCLFWAGIQVVDQCGAAERVVGHLSSLHIQKMLLQKGMEQSGDEWDER